MIFSSHPTIWIFAIGHTLGVPFWRRDGERPANDELLSQMDTYLYLGFAPHRATDIAIATI